MAIVALPAAANNYNQCGERLAKAGITQAVAAPACAEVLHPNDLGRCVQEISAQQVDAMTTLEACRRVRRPLELSTCVQDIHRQDKAAALTNVLEACRVSLLPERYGKCVVGLNQSLGVPTATGLSTCIDASDRPVDVLSTFIPIKDVPRMTGFGAPGQEDSVLQTIPELDIPNVPATPQLTPQFK
jgi:hypothetical protein